MQGATYGSGRHQFNKGILPWSDCAPVHRCFGQGKVGPNFTILDAMVMLTAAWDRVTPETARNCFKKAGIGSEEQKNHVHDTENSIQVLAEELVSSRESGPELVPECVNPDDVIETDQGLLTSISLITD